MARQFTRRAHRPTLKWDDFAFSALALSAGDTSAVVISPVTESQTIVRTRGELLCWMDGAPTPPRLIRVGIGLLVQQAGATATVSPLTDGDAPFFWYDVVTLMSDNTAAGGAPQQPMASSRAVVDGKAMRVLRPDQDIFVVIETADVVGASASDIGFDGRFLIAD